MKLPGTLALRSAVTRMEGRWFDATRNVETSGYVRLAELGPGGLELARRGGFDYLASRPSIVRAALRCLPLKNYADYTFVDLGSGKGRVLFVAAEFPFRKILGVEFSQELYEQGQQNIKRFVDKTKPRGAEIVSLQQDAAEFAFPEGKLVLYLFNPFGPEVLGRVFANLEEALERQPRHVVIVLMNPEFASVLDARPFVRLYLETRRFRIYQTELR